MSQFLNEDMPKRKRSSFAIKRRLKRRRRIYRLKKRRSRNLVLGGFPKSKLVRLRYVEEFKLNPTLGSYAVQHFWANGMYDPNLSGVGHQPSNFDRWMNIYNHYTVLGAKIRVRYAPDNVMGSGAGCYFGILLADASDQFASVFTAGGVQNVLEQRLTKNSKFIVGSHVIVQPCTVTKKFSARKFFGKRRSSDIVASHDYAGDASNNPNEQAIFTVYGMSVGGNDPGEINCIATIEYVAMLTEPKESDAS